VKNTVMVVAVAAVLPFSVAIAEKAQDIVGKSGIKGGLVVHLGCGNGKETISLRVSDSFLVQGLERDAGKVMVARGAALEAGLDGAVTFRHWNSSHLPYADNVVNLVVVEDSFSHVKEDEIRRVLAPNGVALIDGKKIVKPWPEEIDSWTHYLHDASGNPVAADTVVSHPGGLQWNAGPKYCRNHEMDVGVVAVVSDKGRLFSIIDEGIAGIVDPRLPESWSLVARDAFSGVLLWRKPLESWGWRSWKPDMDWSALRAQRRLIPIGLPRRLVAVGDAVFATRVYGGPVECLDAATGESKKVYRQTEGADEIIWHDGKLFVTVRPQNWERSGGKSTACSIMSIDPKSAGVLWKVDGRNVVPLTMMASGPNLFYHSGAGLVCLDTKDGAIRWRGEGTKAKADRWNVSHAVVAHRDVVMVCSMGGLEAFSVKDGKRLWRAGGSRKPFGGSHPANLYVVDGLAWAPAVSDKRRTQGMLKGLDIHTGEVKRTIKLPDFIFSREHHFRCYRGKATDNFILDNKRGTEFMNIRGGEHSKNDWARGVCRYGVLPCNGLLYTTPTPCSCYPSVQLHGFNALTPRIKKRSKSVSSSTPLIKGSAYGKPSTLLRRSEATARQVNHQPSPVGWPTFRGNNMRSGSSVAAISPDIKVKWEAAIGGRLTQPIVADDSLFVASVDEGTVYAVDTETGKAKWHYTVDGRVDSPPTWSDGLLLFGSRNGWLYCLNADSGQLAWRYRIAPNDRQIVSYDRLESLWPIHGSVLVVEDVVYAAAGRNSYLNGGIYLVGLDVKTGKIRHEGRVFHRHQDPARDKGGGYDLPGSKPDVLLSDGKTIFMQNVVFDLSLKQLQSSDALRISCTGGFLDDHAWNRNFWIYGRKWRGGNKKVVEPTKGQLLVHDDGRFFGVRYFTSADAPFSLMFYPAQKGYCLFGRRVNATRSDARTPAVSNSGARRRKRGRKKNTSRSSFGTASLWETWIPVRVNAMIKTGDVVLTAGVPDVLDKDDPMASFEGRKGFVLQTFSAKDGKELSKLELASAPVLDGMIAAHGRLYISAMNGKVLCLGK